jgi:glycosyltransferase involved in cell wall biosynthesis
VRIAVVHSFYSTRQPSGENSVVEDQVEALRSAGHAVRLIARRTDDLEDTRLYSGRAALRVATGRGWSPIEELSAFAPDVVHLHNTFPNISTAWLKTWGHRTVVTLHNFRTVCAAGTLFRDGHACTECLETPVRPAIVHACYRDSKAATTPLAIASRPSGALRRVGRDSAEVVVLNEGARDVFSGTFDRGVHVIPNFISKGVAHPAPHRGWLFVGRLAPEKGIAELMSAWPAEEPLDVVGAGPLEPEIKRLASSRPSIRHVGLQDRHELRARMGGYEGLVLPSLWPEGLPTVVLEALSCGLPIVASDRVAASEGLVSDGVATMLRTPLTEESLRQTLARHRSGGGLRDAALALHAARYSREAWLREMTQVYESVAVQ